MIMWTFVAEALLASALLCAHVDAIAWWWLLPIAIGVFLLLNVGYIILAFVLSLMLGKGENKREHGFIRRMVVRSVKWLLTIMRIRVTVEGKEKLPREPVVLVSNHRSDFDPMAGMVAFSGRRLSYISKESNFHIPIAGPFVRRCWFLAIDRENPRNAVKTIEKAARLIREEGLDIGIYPEGTRTRKGGPRRFKEGAFMMAKWANAPIVLMTTEGTERIAGRTPLHASHVRLRIVEVISCEEVAATPVGELTARAEKTMREALNPPEEN